MDGGVHLVLNDRDSHELVHFQYMDDERGWGFRSGLLSLSAYQSPCLGVSGHRLCCVFKDEKGSGEDTLYLSSWSFETGWTKRSIIHLEGSHTIQPLQLGQRALTGIDGQLDISLTTPVTPKEPKIKMDNYIIGFVDIGAYRWEPMDTDRLPLDKPSSVGIKATTCSGTASLAYSAGMKVSVEQVIGGCWMTDVSLTTKAIPTLKTPGISVVATNWYAYGQTKTVAYSKP